LAGSFPFQLGAVLGQGSSSSVVEGRAFAGGGRVALKIGNAEGERARLADEGELLALVDSPGIPRILDAGTVPMTEQEYGGRPYLALEWAGERAVDPRTINDEERTSLALVVARDVGDALATLHALGLSHGDVKPGNVVVAREHGLARRARLIDFGLAATTDEAVPRGGTHRYLAREALAHGGGSDARARDLWALGATLAELGSHRAATSDKLDRSLSADLPAPLATIVDELLSEIPGRRPSAEWVSARAREALRTDESAKERVARHERTIRRTYLAVRRRDLLIAARSTETILLVEDDARLWLSDSLDKLRRTATLRDGSLAAGATTLSDLDALGRARFLTALVGSAAARWTLPASMTDSALIRRLLQLAMHADPRAVTLGAILSDSFDGLEVNPEDPLALALALGGAAPAAPVLEAAERWVGKHRDAGVLRLALGRALRLSGEPGRAMAVLALDPGAEALAESAECARRAGDVAGALALATRVGRETTSVVAVSRALATRARLLLDQGDPDGALGLLRDHPDSPATLEVRALAELSRGLLERASETAARACALARSDEELARVLAVSGNVAHAAGDSRRALDAFRRAAEHAMRAGAIVEESTYLTGVAAAGFDAGQLDVSLDAATRATLLFEHLGRPRDAARALLSRAATYAAAGASALARSLADLALERAKQAGDLRCRAFAHLVHADVLAVNDALGLEHARSAASLLRDGAAGDRLHAAARLLRRGETLLVETYDALADADATPVPARLDWWGARAVVLLQSETPVRADRVIGALSALAPLPGPVPSRGEAFSLGAALAARVGDGDAVRRFSPVSADAARTLTAAVPPELRVGIRELPWIQNLRAPRESEISQDQLADVESLVRALGTRDRLRPLLDQVLDALVLWTGVERGLLLLRAPGGKLVPRAARNIAREDLHGLQLTLSHSLAERALATGEPVVAVDAAGELPEVHQSVHALKLRSVLAVPLVARGEALGVVYLDDRIRRGAFGPSELAWVRLVATLASVAIADARDQVALRRAARRATRAEARLAVRLARRTAELDVAERELVRARGDRTTRYPYDEIIGNSPKIGALLAMVDRVTQADVPVLIAGESGSGKELIARAIHRNGPRKDAPFVSENCGAIPETLLESTLFGHVRGAFTGASRPHAGLFEVAHGGTLFLDEIGEMSLAMQTKFLRILENGEVRPVGSERPRKVDVRVIAASHRDLASMVAAGRFRQDLFYRLNVILVSVPALRERPGDVEVLARYFVQKHAGGRDIRMSRPALDALSAYSWPGNVRQLENEMRRALVLADDSIGIDHLSPDVKKSAESELARADGLNLRRRVDTLEAELVRAALERTRGNQTRAAELLGLSRFGLQKMIRRLDIAIPGTEALREDVATVTGPR
jgi:transcriptional regulator with GAF, ATPase, and Fis domain/serine/threonine protein kinase